MKEKISELLKEKKEESDVLHYNSVHDPDFPHSDDIDMMAAITHRLQTIVNIIMKEGNETGNS